MYSNLGRKIARLIIAVLSMAIGPAIIATVDKLFISWGFMAMGTVLKFWAVIAIYIAGGLATGALFFFIVAPKLVEWFLKALNYAESKLSQMPLSDIFFCVLGLMTGLLVALLLSTLTTTMPLQWLAVLINTVLYISLGYLGWTLVMKRRNEINIPSWLKRGKKSGNAGSPKILDTSVIIDGRILDICKTGIIEGTLVVPGFVLHELRHIADNADSIKRSRGRRGIDILAQMQKELSVPIIIDEKDYEDEAEVDNKLLRLAYDMGGVVVTTDFNLNKVAGVKDVPVLNINELANALKPNVLPGEDMHVLIIKEGKEQGQGLAYLEDGTMIVVENGRKSIGEECDVVVTSVLQTAAGRMIFARFK